MLIGIYIIFALALSAIAFIVRSKLSYLAVSIFLIFQWSLTITGFLEINTTLLEYFTMDSLGMLFLSILSITGSLSLYYSYLYIEKRKESARKRSLYLAAFIILNASLSCAYLANHIAISWIFVELTTLSSSILIYHRRTEKALEATWKYIFVCSISVALIFMGILFMGMAMQSAGGQAMYYRKLIQAAPQLDSFWLMASFLLIFTGYTVKAGLVPMYTAGIDAKDKAPSPIGGLLSGAVLNVGMVGIIRSYEILANSNTRGWAGIVMTISAAFSIFIAAQYFLRAKNFKRLFAYSSVEHMGLALLGIAMGGIGAFAALLHLTLHSLVKSSLFFQFGAIHRAYNSDLIKDFGGYFKVNVFSSLAVILSFFMITAIPPSGLFVSEFGIFRAMWNKNFIWLIIIIGVLLAFIIWSFGESIFRLIYGNSNEVIEPVSPGRSFLEAAPHFVMLSAVIYLGFSPPDFFVELLNSASMLIQ